MKKSPKLGFSLIELSIVILIIGILVVGITKGSRIVSEARLKSARALTASSPVASTDHLVMWLETTLEKSFAASQAIDTPLSSLGTITTWFDINPQTTLGNDATQNGASNLIPRYVKDGINGLPALNFDGSNDYLDFDGTSLTNNDFTVFMVSKLDQITSNTWLFGGQSQDTLFVIAATTGYVQAGLYTVASSAQYVNSPTSSKPLSFPMITTISHSSAAGLKLYVRQDGVSYNATTLSHTTHLANYNNAFIGKCPAMGGPITLKGNVGEVIIFNKRLTDTERTSIEGYLKTKWGIK